MSPFSTFFLKITNSSWFQNSIIAVILIAGILVGIETYELSSPSIKSYSKILHGIDSIILFIFTIEVLFKVFAQGNRPLNYFKDGWNLFDFFIVLFCYIPFLIPSVNSGFLAVLRLARILRVFKLITALPKLQMLVSALLKSIPSMFYVGILLALLFYIYAAMGVFSFGVNDPIHFGNLQKSLITLFQVVTLEDWSSVLYINMYGCDHGIWGYGKEFGCNNPSPNPFLGAFYFISFVLIGTMIVLNLFIGVIMTAMDDVRAEENQRVSLERSKNSSNEIGVNYHLVQISEQLELLKIELENMKNSK
jgi:voltage-gated sodium channel